MIDVDFLFKIGFDLAAIKADYTIEGKEEIDFKEREQVKVLTDKLSERKSQTTALYDRMIKIIKSLKPLDTLEEDDSLIEYLSKNTFGTMQLSTGAKKAFIGFSNELTDAANISESDYLKSMYAKFEIHCLRLALILELVSSYPHGLDDKCLSDNTMNYAIQLCRYFIACGLKVEQLGSHRTNNEPIDKIAVARYLTVSCNISQSETARILGCSQQYINKKLKD
jgi:hypothetical protein